MQSLSIQNTPSIAVVRYSVAVAARWVRERDEPIWSVDMLEQIQTSKRNQHPIRDKISSKDFGERTLRVRAWFAIFTSAATAPKIRSALCGRIDKIRAKCFNEPALTKDPGKARLSEALSESCAIATVRAAQQRAGNCRRYFRYDLEIIMQIDLTGEEVQTILESLRYSKQRIADAEGSQYEIRRENLARIEQAMNKLRNARSPADEDR
jgi:hypothetical protein